MPVGRPPSFKQLPYVVRSLLLPPYFSAAHNGTTRPSTAVGSTWPNPNSACSRRSVWIAASPHREDLNAVRPCTGGVYPGPIPRQSRVHHNRTPHGVSSLVSRFLVASPPVRDLFLCAKHLFFAAMPGGGSRMSNGSANRA